MKDMLIFYRLSALLDYPGPDYYEKVDLTEDMIQHSYAHHFMSWSKFARSIRLLNLGNLQVLFISSFDVKASSSLDVGHVLFGEDKKRNNFLIHLSEEHAKVHHDCGREMPDYLPNLLQLIAVSKEGEFTEEISVSIILPALRLMNSGLNSQENPYTNLFELLIEIIEVKYPDSIFTEYIPVAKTTCNFSKSHCHHG